MIATEGKTYTIKTEQLTEAGQLKQDNLARWEYMTADDYETVETDYIVPNGKWVMEHWVTLRGSGEVNMMSSRFVGNHERLMTITLERSGQSMRNLYVSDEPFGLISWETSQETWQPMAGMYFQSAKQIHKGELGRLVPVPQLSYVRENKSEVRGWARGKRKYRSHIGWVKASELVAVTGLSFVQIIEIFWPFVDTKALPEGRRPVTLDMLFGVTAEQIKQRNRSILQFTQDELLDTLEQDPDAYNDVWIREGLAKTILRLFVLDYMPVRMTHA